MNIFCKFKECLKKTSDNFSNKLRSIFSFFTKVDEDFLDELEELLITSDVSISAASKIKEKLREEAKFENAQSPDQVIGILKNIINKILYKKPDDSFLKEPSIILVIGVNGVGKTTIIGKLGNIFKNKNKKVLIVAADTFRAAASCQLKIWADRAGCEILEKHEGSDPGSVIFEAIKKSKIENFDLIICDTAGRLHNKSELMAELRKVYKIIDKNATNYKKEFLLVLDVSTGQNMINQVEQFSKILNITGLILTKLDGTAKGGAIVSVREKFENIPIRYVGLGESIDDIDEFFSDRFTEALLGR